MLKKRKKKTMLAMFLGNAYRLVVEDIWLKVRNLFSRVKN